MGRFACMVRVSRFDDEVRAALAALGITETYPKTNPESDSSRPVDLRVVVPAGKEVEADAALVRALHGTVEYEPQAGWHQMPDDWDG